MTVAANTKCALFILLLSILIALHGLLSSLRHIFVGVEAQGILTIGFAGSQTVLSRYQITPSVRLIARMAALLFPLLAQPLDVIVELKARVLV